MGEPRARRAAEWRRLEEDLRRQKYWKRWGPYLSERQWATVREDYSADGDSWSYFPHEHARSRAYRWGEDGLLGITEGRGRLCFALSLWNEKDPILKERLFGLTGPQGNHGEDVKECYFYLDSLPTHSYMKALYKYPHGEFPYEVLVEENRRRGFLEPEFELLDTGIFEENRYFDVFVEYAKNSPTDILIRIAAANRGPEPASLHLLPTLWFRNTWSWGGRPEGDAPGPRILRAGERSVLARHPELGDYVLEPLPEDGVEASEPLFTENVTNSEKLFGVPNATPYVKDAFHEYVLRGRRDAVSPEGAGTKSAIHHRLEVPAGGELVVRLRLATEEEAEAQVPVQEFEGLFARRRRETDEFYQEVLPEQLSEEERRISRQAYAGLLWTKQFYHYIVKEWLEGDPVMPPPPERHKVGRNRDWEHLYNLNVVSVPDKWEFPWYAAWDLAFHMIPFARIDPDFARGQLVLFLREWYMHPNGQLPAYEFALSDVNPPVHAWACWNVYRMTRDGDDGAVEFLERVFHKLLIDFTWWVNRKDVEGKHIFAGGFLGMDNIGVFDRSMPLPAGGHLEQADGTAWMAFYCATMLAIALELARERSCYEDVASKFFEHFVAIADAINTMDGSGLWDEEDGFYYSRLNVDGHHLPLRLRSMVGLVPLLAVDILDAEVVDRLPGFQRRMRWLLEYRQDLARHIAYCETRKSGGSDRLLLAIPTREKLERELGYMLDEREFLSPYGIRSLSRVYLDKPYVFKLNGTEHVVRYVPGDSDSGLYGGNSNWRGPVWFPMNYLIIEALETYHRFYGDSLKVECPTGSGHRMNLHEVAVEIAGRLAAVFLPDGEGFRPCHGGDARFAHDPHWRKLILFYEYFHGDDGRGLGANHQTGWTALVAQCLEKLAGQS